MGQIQGGQTRRSRRPAGALGRDRPAETVVQAVPDQVACQFPQVHQWGGMTFTSWQFGMLVAVVFGAYYLPPLRTFQIQLLVIASLVFYGYR